MAQKEVLIKINVDDKSLNQLTGDVKALGGEIQKIENIGAGLSIDQKFKAAQGSIKAFAGSVEAAVGAIGLLGIESKIFDEYERYALSVLSFGRGIFDLSEGINDLRESGALANVVLKAQDALNKVTTVSARALGIATNTTSTAFKNLKAAIAGTGIGLLVVAIGYAIQKMIEFADANKAAKEEADKFNESLRESKQLLQEETELLSESLETRLLLLEEAGASEKDLEIARREYHQDLLTRYREAEDEAYRAIDVAKTLGKEQQKAAEESLAGIQKARAKAETDEAQRRIRQRITTATEAKDAAKKAKEDAVKLAQGRADAELKIFEETAITKAQLEYSELEAVNNKYDELVKLANQYGLSTIDIENKRNLELTKLFEKYEREDIERRKQQSTTIQNLDIETQASFIRTMELQGEEYGEIIRSRFALQLRELRTSQQAEKDANLLRYQEGIISEEEYRATLFSINEKYDQLTKEAFEQNNADILANNLAIDDALLNSKLNLYYQIGSAFGNLSQLFEEGTDAAKAAALAEIGINTAVGYVQGLDIAQKSAAGTGPAAAFAFPIFYATQIAAVLGAAAQAKRILSTSKSGGTTAGSVAGTSAPNAPSQTISPSLFDLQALPQGQLARVPGGVKQEPIRAYVLAGDVSSAQEADAKLNLKRTVN